MLLYLNLGKQLQIKTQSIHILQKKSLRAINFSERRSESRPIFHKLEVLNIFEIVDYQLAELAFRYSTDQLPDIFRIIPCFWGTRLN